MSTNDVRPTAGLISQAISNIRARRFTRLATIVAVAMSGASLVITGWLAWVIYDSGARVRAANLVPQLDEKFDSIAAAASVGRLDVLAVVMTFIGIMAGLSLIYGWTAFRSAAIEASLKELEKELPAAIFEHMKNSGADHVAKALRDPELLAQIQERFTAIGIGDTRNADEIDSDPNFWEDDDAT